MNHEDHEKIIQSLIEQGKTTGKDALKALQEWHAPGGIEHTLITLLLSDARPSALRDIVIAHSKGAN